MKAKKYTREEWEAAKSLKNCGFTWAQVCEKVGRAGDTLGRTIVKYGDYENYLASYRRNKAKAPERKTEQLQFIPPEMPTAPKKIQVKSMSEEEWTRRKLAMATRQAVAVKNFISELRNVGFEV